MKKLFLLSLSSILLMSCSDVKEEKAKDYLVISGKVNSFKKRKIEISNDYDFEKEIDFNKKSKTFLDTLRNITPGHYTLKINRRRVSVYLSSIDDLKLMVDAKKRIVDPYFEGKNTAINNFLWEREKKQSILLGNINKLYTLNEHDFLSKMDEFKSKLIDLAKASNLPSEYLAKEIKNTHYQFALAIKNYQSSHRIMYGDDKFVVSKNFPLNIPKKVSYDLSEDYIFSKSYRELIQRKLNDITNKEKYKNGNYDLTYLDVINSKVKDTLIKNHLLYSTASYLITDTPDLKSYYENFINYSTNESNNKKITSLFNKLKATAKGNISPKFKNYENYKGGTTSLDDLIGKGNYIYIDVWATWCGPCKKETPFSQKLEQQFHGKNIDFVGISVDKATNKEKWKKMIADRGMGGIQLFAGNSKEKSKFAKDYLIKGLPRFILIDPNGKIVSPNAPRPSDGQLLIDMFEELGI